MRIAVVGSGISGMLAAYLLAGDHELTVFEADARIGGHTNTIDVEFGEERLAVDTGFIVYNDWTYPNFIRLLEKLEVPTQTSDMSFSVTCRRTGLEYNGTSIDTLFAQRRNILRPSFWRMVRDILRFNREAPGILGAPDDSLTLGDLVLRGRYSREFVDHYLFPMGAAIWSSGREQIRDFPAHFFVRFFHNHGMLSVDDRPQWRVLQGGSRSYIGPLTAPYSDRIRLGTPVRGISRDASGVTVRARGCEPERFDEVVIAAHSDQALAMLENPSDAEREILGALPYQANRAVLHRDDSVMPRARKAWASWNYTIPRGESERVTVTYWMNLLQSLRSRETFFVTLNPVDAIDPATVVTEIEYHHPLFTTASIRAQERYDEIGGRSHRTHYCGAYWRNGFHEDGIVSALRVAAAFGKSL